MFSTKTTVRFWTYVKKSDKDSCWNWIGATNGAGYGQFHTDFGKMVAHRISYIMEHGNIPVGMHACHKCDNPLCVNPNHLFIGTAKDKSNDAKSKNRLALGIRRKRQINPIVTLSPAQETIAKMAGTGMTSKEIGQQLQLSAKTVEKHREAINKILGINTTAQLVHYLLHHKKIKNIFDFS
jgi:DNA-binding CsgD family transcriptional regulator